MINKIVGYGGFRSYNQQPYPTKKQGKELEDTNQIWTATRRAADKVNPLENYHHYQTLYKKGHVENTKPQDYHPDIVKKGAHSTLNFAGTSKSKAFDQTEAQKAGRESYRQGHNLLKTGTQHWKTNYQAELGQSAKLSKTTGNNFGLRSQSTGKPSNPHLVDQALSKALSYKNRAYVNNVKTGTTDYRFNYGQKIGSTPYELLSKDSSAQPVRNHPLKHGTNQLWTEIPGYQGFKPSELHFEEVKSKINQRASVDRGNQKLNLLENYHVNVPGYAGFKPKYSNVSNQLRDSCFEYKPK